MDAYTKGLIALVIAGIAVALIPFAFFWERKKKRQNMKKLSSDSDTAEISVNTIEELKSKAIQAVSEYQSSVPKENLTTASEFYSKAYRIFMEHMGLHGPASPEAWSEMRDTVFRAVEAAPENAVLFNACLDLVDENESVHHELGQKWPTMFRSHQLSQQAEKMGLSSILSSLGFEGVTDITTGSVQEFPPEDILTQGGVKTALDAVRSCPTNPEAWFQLRFHVSQAGYKPYAEAFQEVENRLKEAQGAQLLKEAKESS